MSQRDPRGTVHVVDDELAVRDSLAALFQSVGLDVKVYADPTEILDSEELATPSCLVLDVRMPGMSGMDLYDKLRERGVDTPVIFITGHGDIPLAVQAMKAGAFDFLEKPYRPQDLLSRVSAAIQGDMERQKTDEEKREIEKRVDLLTPREREVLRNVTAGRTSKGIASELNISLKTVEVHRSRILEKMQARNVVDLVRMVVSSGASLTKG